MMHPTRFELKPEHVLLLRHVYVERAEFGYSEGGFESGVKRPFGNSDIAWDIHEITHGLPRNGSRYDDDDRDRLSAEDERTAMRLYDELATALQIVLATGSFEPGTYTRSDPYEMRDWTIEVTSEGLR